MLSRDLYDALCGAYESLNASLFDDSLPSQVVLTLQPKAKAYGFFEKSCWGVEGSAFGEEHQITLNPHAMRNRTRQDHLATLAHEMVHLWQKCYGEHDPDKPYHNFEWAEEMTRIGLIPSVTSQPGGGQTGKNVGHYIQEEGMFAQAAPEILAEYPLLFTYLKIPKLIVKPEVKKKYLSECRLHQIKAWCHEGVSVLCPDCKRPLERKMKQLPLLTVQEG